MANVMPRRRSDGSTVYRVRVRSLGICISRTFPTETEAAAYAESVERNLDGRAPAELETLAGLIDRYTAHEAPESGAKRLRYWREKIGTGGTRCFCQFACALLCCAERLVDLHNELLHVLIAKHINPTDLPSLRMSFIVLIALSFEGADKQPALDQGQEIRAP